jgi:translation initiation factor 2B subunit (eIF-2B alpha/beta/delta family)
VLADSRKLWINQPRSEVIETFQENMKPVSEIWRNLPPGILAENYYFESIPNTLVEFFITETGIYPGKEIYNLK